MAKVRFDAAKDKVLIVTGGATVGRSMVEANNTILSSLGRQFGIMGECTAIWQDVALNAVSAELLGARVIFNRRRKFKKANHRNNVDQYFSAKSYVSSPELTEIVLAGAFG